MCLCLMTPAVDPVSDLGPTSSAREPLKTAHWSWALSLQYSAQLKNAQFSVVMYLFKIKLSCPQNISPLMPEHVKCAVCTSISRSGAKIVLSPALVPGVARILAL